jgi:hypothetical protein
MARYQEGQDPRKQKRNKDQLKASIRVTPQPNGVRVKLKNDNDPNFYYNGKKVTGAGLDGPYTAKPVEGFSITGQKEFDIKRPYTYDNSLGGYGRYVRGRNKDKSNKNRFQ